MKPIRILIVEDEFIIGHDLQGALVAMGYEVPVVLASAEDIVQKAQELAPDLVLMDIHIDGKVDGIQAASLLKEKVGTPVVFLTSYTDPATVERAKVTEPLGYLIKPYQHRDVRTTIEMAVYKAQMDRKLREREEWFATLLRSIDDGVFACDPSGQVTFMNPVAEALTGATQDACRGKKLDQVITIHQESSNSPVPLPLGEVIGEKKRVWLEKIMLVAADGQRIPIEGSWTPIRNGEDKVSGAVFICRDIRGRRAAEKKQKDLEAQVMHVQKLESIGVLAGGIAHDFNNLLCIILGNSSLVLTGLLRPEEVNDKVKMIELTAVRASELVKQLLSYSGKNKSQMEPANLSEILNEIGSLLKTSISKKIKLEYTYTEDLPLFLGDLAQLRQVAMNLILNASDAIGENAGSIKVSTGVTQASTDELSGALMGHGLKPGRFVYLQVSDTGCGMDEATKAKIFDPFFTTKVTGRGLGLAVVLGIVRSHGGAIAVESEKGKGTTFKVLFPAESNEVRVSDRGGSFQKNRKNKGTGAVLVIDDESSILGFVREVLEQEGFQVFTADGGSQGVEIFKQNSSKIVAVLLDMTMSDMSGEETADQLRQVRPDVKIIMTSGYQREDVISRLAPHQITHFIQKPYLREDFLTKMYGALDTNAEP